MIGWLTVGMGVLAALTLTVLALTLAVSWWFWVPLLVVSVVLNVRRIWWHARGSSLP